MGHLWFDYPILHLQVGSTDQWSPEVMNKPTGKSAVLFVERYCCLSLYPLAHSKSTILINY